MQVRVHYEVPPDEEPRVWDRGIRMGLRNATLFWQREMAAGHFEQGAAGKYGYAPRTKKYQIRKAKRWGHQQPLVWTGVTRDWVRSRFAQPSVRREGGQGLKARLQILAPGYFYRWHGGHQQDKVAELLTTTDAESAKLLDVLDDALQTELSRPRRRRRVSGSQ